MINYSASTESLKQLRPTDYNTGVGGVGRHFLTQLRSLTQRYPDVTLSLISRSTKCLFTSNYSHGLSTETWEKDLEASEQPVLSLSEVREFLVKAPGKCVLIDNTSNQAVAESYPTFLSNGISVVTPNKKAFSGSFELWQRIFDVACTPKNPKLGLIYHESSVGAGLPVISTLKDLVDTGDHIVKIEGIFSGTMSFLFNSFAPVEGTGGNWSAEVLKAKNAGYTEPDPRDDLNGLDVARKLVILARLAGLEIQSTSSFPVQSLIPKVLESVPSAEEFMQRLPDFDSEMEGLKQEAEKEGKVVRFVGSIDVLRQSVKVGLEKFEKSHPIAALKGSDNIISFYTKRYGANPLIIQGAG